MLRVGRCVYKGVKTPRSDPSYEGFTPIIVLMKGHSKYGELGPYDLVDEKGRIHENIWQFSKVYEKIPKSKQKFSRTTKTIVWDHPAETHIKDGELTDEYYKWRKKGMYNKYAVRYPVGFYHRHKCLYALADGADGKVDVDNQLGYIESRKEIYVKEYCRLVKKEPKFKELKARLEKGDNLLIFEVDGPHQESLQFYKNKYKVDDDFIENGTMVANKDNLKIMLNDTKHPFGHGYCLAMAILDIDVDKL